MNLETFYPYIQPEVLTCPEPLIKNALILAADDFCIESSAWRSDETVTTASGTSEYEPGKPSDSYIIAFRSVFAGTRQLTAVQSIVGEEEGEPFIYTSPDFGVLLVYPTPNSVASLSVDCIYGPTPTATTLPDFMIRQVSTLSAGAKGRLLAMSGADWANPTLAAYYTQVFRDGVIAARIKEEHGRNPSSLTVKPRSFG